MADDYINNIDSFFMQQEEFSYKSLILPLTNKKAIIFIIIMF